MRIHFVVACLAGVTLLSGCGKEGATVEINRKDVSVKVAGGDQTVALPDGFPKDAPIMPGGAIKTAMVAKDITSVAMTTPSQVADVVKYYEDNLKAQGWTVAPTQVVGQATFVTATKDERNLSVQATKSNDGSAVMMSLRPKGG